MAKFFDSGPSDLKISFFEDQEPQGFNLDQSISPINYFKQEPDSPLNIYKIMDINSPFKQADLSFKSDTGTNKAIDFSSESGKYIGESIPEPESFINDEDEFYSRFLQKSMSTINDSNEDKSVDTITHKRSRAGRWLKQQDRELMFTFYQMIRNYESTKSHEFWVDLKASLKTDRPVKFLRRRYRKLARTQTLNKHEKLFFKENKDKFSTNQFMIIFPGKTRDTIGSLYKDLELQNSHQTKINQIVTEKLREGEIDIKICENSKIVNSVTFDKEMSSDILDISEIGTDEYLSKCNPKALRKVQYMLNQMVGEVYSKIYNLKACIKSDVAF